MVVKNQFPLNVLTLLIILSINAQVLSELYLEPCQIYEIDLFVRKAVNYFANSTNLDFDLVFNMPLVIRVQEIKGIISNIIIPWWWYIQNTYNFPHQLKVYVPEEKGYYLLILETRNRYVFDSIWLTVQFSQQLSNIFAGLSGNTL